ncbi:sumo ligase, putative [Entamoeba invadens IP1]|uniref:Sumo ligase, putative n=1 Tax=Entamoeba invadens IP1 TaxID=370355 RepID=L7FLZ2_ENTIV|nr:sumo ligase, putative [Entamoeba invadens IP1]ELP84878.1 sumo ligase, putative [Entamoeba invadens IP1]|eukprot:XP_004184224.1 sumo ligase, putative [Entamoeba invadens IP1]
MKVYEWLETEHKSEVLQYLHLSPDDYTFDVLFDPTEKHLSSNCYLNGFRSYLLTFSFLAKLLQPPSNFSSTTCLAKDLCNVLNTEMSDLQITLISKSTSYNQLKSFDSFSVTETDSIQEHVIAANNHVSPKHPNSIHLNEQSTSRSKSKGSGDIMKYFQTTQPFKLPDTFYKTLLPYYKVSRILLVKENSQYTPFKFAPTSGCYLRVIDSSGKDVSVSVEINNQINVFEEYDEKKKYTIVPFKLKRNNYLIRTEATVVIFSTVHETQEDRADRLYMYLKENKRFVSSSGMESSEIEETSRLVSLRCPYSIVKMKHPVRGQRCTHETCVDILSVVSFWEKHWTCCQCNKLMYWEDVVLDVNLEKIIQQAPGDAEFVEICGESVVAFLDGNKKKVDMETSGIIDVDSFKVMEEEHRVEENNVIDVDNYDSFECEEIPDVEMVEIRRMVKQENQQTSKQSLSKTTSEATMQFDLSAIENE